MARRGGWLPSSRWIMLTPVVALGAYATVGPMPAGLLSHPAHGAHRIIQAGTPHGGTEVRYGWTPYATRMVAEVRHRWPAVSCGGQADGTETGHIPGSDHYTGNAADCTAGRYGVRATGTAKATNDAVAAWVIANADRLHVAYVIWYARIDNLDGHGWQPYCDQLDPTCTGITYEHYDHVHVSVVH